MLFSLSLVTFLLACSPTLIMAACYYPNGTEQSSPEVQACPKSTSKDDASMCCATNRDSSNPAPDESCLDNGLCRFFNSRNSANETWRETCTDPTWKSPHCIKFCIEGIEERHRDRSTSEALVTPCGDGTYCCGANQIDCCVKHEGFFLVNGTASAALPSPTASTTSNSTSSTTAAGQSPDDTTDRPPDKQSSDTAKKAGTGAGVGVACLAIVVGLVVAIRTRRKKRKAGAENNKVVNEEEPPSEKDTKGNSEGRAEEEEEEEEETGGQGTIAELEETTTRWGGEMDGKGLVAEVEGEESRVELEGERVSSASGGGNEKAVTRGATGGFI